MTRLGCVRAAAMLTIFSPLASGFSPLSSPMVSTSPRLTAGRRRLVALQSYPDNNGSPNEEAQLLIEKARQYRREAEKLKLSLDLKKIETLESDIRKFVGERELNRNESKGGSQRLGQLHNRVINLVRESTVMEQGEVDKMLEKLAHFSTDGEGINSQQSSDGSTHVDDQYTLTDAEMKAAIALINSLPISVKHTLAITAGYEDYHSSDGGSQLVQRIYEHKMTSSVELRRLYARSFMPNPTGIKLDETDARNVILDDSEENYGILETAEILVSELEESMERNRAMELFPRALQDVDEDLQPSEEDVHAIFKLLDRTTFMATEKPVKVNGGYLIRGVNKRRAANELLRALEKKIEGELPRWMDSFQLNYVEITADPNSEEFVENAILITPNKFPVLAPVALGFGVTALAFFCTFLYGIETFGGNQLVMDRLRETSEMSASIAATGVVYDLGWFNDLLVPLLATLGLTQGFHEAGHLLVARWKKINVSAPTILPSQGLPYLSFQNRLKSSPNNYTDLFDFAFAGPITGLTVSLVALLYGLQLTTTVDPSTARLLPSLSAGFLSQSSLGCTLVDLVLSGGDGILLNQDTATQIPLHPVAIAGFLGLFINALDLLPIGSTDGGRMSQAALGRVWHLTFSSLIFAVLFVASFVSDTQNILLGYLFIYSFTQRDLEIVCKNEVDKIESPRVIAAVVSWLIAALILVPIR